MNIVFDQYLASLDRTERLPLRELARYQQTLLARLVRHASTELPFYRDRLRPLFGQDGKVDLSRWNEVPIVTRDDVIAHGCDMRVPNLAAEYGEVGETQTSGSTGVPLRIASNGLVTLIAGALLTRTARRFSIDTSRALGIIVYFANNSVPPYPEGGLKKGWSPADPSAPCYELELLTPVDQQVEWLARRRPAYLLTLPSNALGIAYAVTPTQGRTLGIEAVIMVGETVPDAARELVAERLGARVVAIYASQEVGHIASQCEAATHYHVAAENVLVEIVGDEGRDVAPGGRGRVIVTGLYNYAMPFIRYDIGDVAVAGTKPCACGRTLPVIERIVGRTRHMFMFRDGTRLWPRSFHVLPMQAFVPFRRYQLVQLDYETIEFRYEPDGSGREPDLAALTAYARQAIHPSVTMRLVAVERLAVGPSGKLEEFVSTLPEANR